MKILVVDDHALIREALRGVLKELKGDAVVLEASDCHQTTRLIEEHPDLDLMLLDLTLPDGSGLGMLAGLRDSHPAMSIVVLSALQDRDNVLKALDLGAQGFIPKSAQRAVMLSALQLILSGGIYIPPEILAGQTPPGAEALMPATDSQKISPSDLGLTDRQIEVLALMMEGKSNKAICRVLDLAEPTVKNHVTAILKALKVTNRTEAVIAVGELGWELPRPTKP
jgi:DNA-binding NarL/FixJ family response regulator